MNLLDSFDYRLEKWRYESFLGLRKIVWLYISIALLAVFPAFSTGRFVANLVTARSEQPKVQPFVTDSPNFRIETPSALSYGNNLRGFYARVSNRIDDSRRNIGYSPWVYRYEITDINNTVIESGQATTYLLPNSDSYIIGPVIRQAGINFKITTDTTRSVATKFDLASSRLLEIPIVTVANSARPVINSDNPQLLDIRFSIQNQSLYSIRAVDCIFIIRNPDGQIIGIGKFIAANLNKNEIREIALSYPAPNLGTNASLEVLPQVNYLDEENLKLVIN